MVDERMVLRELEYVEHLCDTVAKLLLLLFLLLVLVLAFLCIIIISSSSGSISVSIITSLYYV